MPLFDLAIDYSQEIFRNIRTIKISENLFDDLSDDPLDWDAVNLIETYTHPALTGAPLIQRAFDYSKNEFVDYPFENITESRYSDGSYPCWYGSETLETSICETRYHFIQEIRNAWDVTHKEKIITVDRRVGKVYCQGLAFDISKKADEFPWLIDPTNYIKSREVGRRVAKEGHPLLRVPSARDRDGINLVAFKPEVLSNPKDNCYLQYVFDLKTKKITVFRGDKLMLEPISVEI